MNNNTASAYILCCANQHNANIVDILCWKMYFHFTPTCSASTCLYKKYRNNSVVGPNYLTSLYMNLAFVIYLTELLLS